MIGVLKKTIQEQKLIMMEEAKQETHYLPQPQNFGAAGKNHV